MCSSKANFSWDVIIKKYSADIILIDKREEENMLDWQTVSETCSQVDYQPLDEPIDSSNINGARQLMKEAAHIQIDYLAAALKSNEFKKFERDDPNEEAEDQKLIRMGYKYNIFKLKGDLTICIRCQVHSYNEKMGGEVDFANMFVLHEWNEKRQNWAKDLDSSTASMLLKEVTDNANKFSRWTIQSIIDGVEKMRFAFVQRMENSTTTHKVVGATTVNTISFAKQINLSIANCWAVFKDVIETVVQQEESNAEYLYLKEPLTDKYRLIKMGEETNEEDEDSDEDNDGLI